MGTPATFERSGDVSKPKYFEQYERLGVTESEALVSRRGDLSGASAGSPVRVDGCG